MVPRMLPCILIAAAPLGCAEISRGEPKTQDKVLRIERSVIAGSEIDADIELSQSTLHVLAMSRCDLVETKRIQRTTRYTKKNEAFGPEMALLVIGTIPAGFGIGLLADAPSVYEHDRRARLYNATGPGGAIAGGVALTALGAAFMVVPVVDLVRTIGSDEDKQDVTENGPAIEKGVPCRSIQPAPSRSVAVTARGQTFQVGSTGSNGRLTVDLANVVPLQLGQGPEAPGALDVLINGNVVGEVKLAPILEARRERERQREDAAWQATNSPACRDGDVTACQQVRSFLMTYPNGAHAMEALRILDPNAGRAVQVAASPAEIAKAEAAAKKAEEAAEAAAKAAEAAVEGARKAATDACRKKCESACKKEAMCTKGCVEEACE